MNVPGPPVPAIMYVEVEGLHPPFGFRSVDIELRLLSLVLEDLKQAPQNDCIVVEEENLVIFRHVKQMQLARLVSPRSSHFDPVRLNFATWMIVAPSLAIL